MTDQPSELQQRANEEAARIRDWLDSQTALDGDDRRAVDVAVSRAMLAGVRLGAGEVVAHVQLEHGLLLTLDYDHFLNAELEPDDLADDDE